ncbi:MAG: hypothetical protein AAGD11_13810 [Planctomycetota bacterium]
MNSHLFRNCLPMLACAALLEPGSAVHAEILIDDFTQPSASTVFPLVDDIFGGSPSQTEIISTGLGDVERFVLVAAGVELPPPNPLPTDQTVTVSLDTAAGELASIATSQATTLVALAWVTGTQDALDLDVTGMPAIAIDYTSNTDTDGNVTIANQTVGNAESDSGNTFDFVFPAGSGRLVIPLDDITGDIFANRRFENGMPVSDLLPPLDRTSVDGVLVTIGRTDSDPADIPLGLEFSISRVAFVPEPISLWMALTGCLAMSTTRKR